MDISVFGSISYRNNYPLNFYEGRLNSTRYREILTEYYQKFKTFEMENFVVQMDNASCHNGKSNITYFKNFGIHFLKHLPSSPDLNSIEHIWG